MTIAEDQLTVRIARTRIRDAVKGYRLRSLTRQAMRTLIEIERSMTSDMVLEAPFPEDDECEIVGTPEDVLALALRALHLHGPRCVICRRIAEYKYTAFSWLDSTFVCGDHKPDLAIVTPTPARDAIVALRRLGYV